MDLLCSLIVRHLWNPTLKVAQGVQHRITRQHHGRGRINQALRSTRPHRGLIGRPSSTSPLRSRAFAAADSPTSIPFIVRRLASNSPSRSANASVVCSTDEVSPGNHVAAISVSNPSKLNIVNSILLSQLQQTCQTLSRDPRLRAVILTGAPTAAGKSPSFIGGADITEMIDFSSSSEARAFILNVHATCAALRELPVPVIARIHGFCLGAGLEIAASCDLRIATASSVFGMPEVKVGIPSVVEAALLPSLIGMGRTRRFLYLAENISAAEAEQWGLVEATVADEVALDSLVRGWTDKLVGMGPKAIRSQKALMRTWENVNVDEGIAAGVEAYAAAYADGGREPKEFMRRFTKRKR